jgi:hypothetical protein
MISLKKVVVDNLYDTIHGYVTDKECCVDDYDSMIEVIISMIKEGYCFTMDRDILRDAMESLTYMYAPSDDMNKDRLVQQFADEDDGDDENDDTEEEDEGFGNMDLMKMMQMMGGMGGAGAPCMGHQSVSDTTEDTEGIESGECKKVVTDTVVETDETTVVKEEPTDTVVKEEPTDTVVKEEPTSDPTPEEATTEDAK